MLLSNTVFSFKHAREVAHPSPQLYSINPVLYFAIVWGTGCPHFACFQFVQPGHRKTDRFEVYSDNEELMTFQKMFHAYKLL